MSEERRKVLELLAAGKISPDEAERLLEKLSAGAGRSVGDTLGEAISEVASIAGVIDDVVPAGKKSAETTRVWGWQWPGGGKKKNGVRYLRVVVDSEDGENVNIRVPMGLIRTGLKLSTMVPSSVNRKLSESGVDLSSLGALDDEELVQQLAELQVDVNDGGDKVRIFCE